MNAPPGQNRFRLRAALLVLTILLGSLPSEAASWKTFRARAGFSMEVPNDPVVVATTHHSMFGRISSCRYTARKGNAVFTVNVSGLPRWALRISGPEVVLDRAVEAFVAEAGVSTFMEGATRLAAVSGRSRHLHYRVTTSDGGRHLVGRADFLVKGDSLYVFDVALRGAEEPILAERFLGSIRWEDARAEPRGIAVGRENQ